MRDQSGDMCWLIILKRILNSELRECVAANRILRAQSRNYFVDNFKYKSVQIRYHVTFWRAGVIFMYSRLYQQANVL